MISIGGSSKKATTSQQTDPWKPAIPYLNEFLSDIGGASSPGPTTNQTTAIQQLIGNAGNEFAPQIKQLATDAFNTTSRAPGVDAAYGELRDNIGATARGDFLDFESNPYIQRMLADVGNDVQSRIQGVFAGAGRDVVGNAQGQGAIAKGVTSAQLPILQQLYQTERDRQLGASTTLHSAGVDAARTGQALDASALATRAGGVDVSNAYMAARDAGPNAILNLEQQLKNMPLEDLSLYASLLLPTAGLGQQSTGTQKTTGTSWGLDGSLKNVGTLGNALMLSDERAKEDMVKIGETNDGQPIYRYKYIGSNAVHIGLKAQDVEKRNPDAVVEIGGLKHVDYAAATRNSGE
jgi:hypothetical protein